MEALQGDCFHLVKKEKMMQENRFFEEIHGNFGFGCMRLPMKNGEVDYWAFAVQVPICRWQE